MLIHVLSMLGLAHFMSAAEACRIKVGTVLDISNYDHGEAFKPILHL
jgi:hypothetical protein